MALSSPSISIESMQVAAFWKATDVNGENFELGNLLLLSFAGTLNMTNSAATIVLV